MDSNSWQRKYADLIDCIAWIAMSLILVAGYALGGVHGFGVAASITSVLSSASLIYFFFNFAG